MNDSFGNKIKDKIINELKKVVIRIRNVKKKIRGIYEL